MVCCTAKDIAGALHHLGYSTVLCACMCTQGSTQQTCHEASHDKLDGEHLAFLHDGNIGVWNGQQSIWGDVLCVLHPPCASLV